jgi:hypothetical protein
LPAYLSTYNWALQIIGQQAKEQLESIAPHTEANCNDMRLHLLGHSQKTRASRFFEARAKKTSRLPKVSIFFHSFFKKKF